MAQCLSGIGKVGILTFGVGALVALSDLEHCPFQFCRDIKQAALLSHPALHSLSSFLAGDVGQLDSPVQR
ncbi:hypothetical protein D3C72_1906010 [compost metagenome]